MGIIISDRKLRWHNGIVPYEINDQDFPLKDNRRATIQAAIDHWNQNTVISLRPRSNEKDYVQFVAASGSCSSAVGRKGGRQTIGCDLNTFRRGSIIHEIGHAVGLFHEHTREDRDRFVTVHFDNIKDDRKFAYEKKNKKAHDVGPYDYGSIMHYPGRGTNFAIDTSKNTITAPTAIGQRNGLSNIDIATVTESYGPPTERLFATFRRSNEPDFKVHNWQVAHFDPKYDELWPQGWRLRDIQPYQPFGQTRYRAIWYLTSTSTEELQVYDWQAEHVRARYNEELWTQGWRIEILRPYVVNGRVLYAAVWRKSNEPELQVYQWREQDFDAKYDELWPQGWRLNILQPYVLNGQVYYDATWRRSDRRELQVYGWKPRLCSAQRRASARRLAYLSAKTLSLERRNPLQCCLGSSARPASAVRFQHEIR